MRKVPLIPGAVAVLGLVAVGLVGCSQSPASDCSPAVGDAKLNDLVSVSGDVGEAPDVDVYTPFHTTTDSSVRVVDGEGTPITTDSQLVIMDFTILSGESGDVVYQSGYSGTASPTLLGGLTQTIPAMSAALHCATAGSRTVASIVPGGIVAEAAASLGLADEDSAIVVVDIQKVYLPRAEGSLVFNAGGGPAVVRAPDGRPGVTIPEGDAPAEAHVQTLIRGDGEEVTGDAPVRINYLTVDWDTKEVVESSWDAEPLSVTLASTQEDLAKALTGQTVGSQLLVVLPAVAAQDGTAAQAARVFVIDILGLDPVA